MRDEGTTPHYIPLSYPAVADLTIVNALCQAGERLGHEVHAGIVRSTDALYADLAPASMPLQALYGDRPDAMWARANVLCAEMEAAALFVVSSIRGLRAGCVLSVVNATGEGEIPSGAPPLDRLIATAIEALCVLIRRDGSGR